MLPRERVIQVIRRRKPDRMPVYGWVRANLAEPIAEAFGSVEAFEDQYEFDFAHLFGGPSAYVPEALAQIGGRTIDPDLLLSVPMTDPNDTGAYADIVQQVRHHKEQRGRFVYVQTPGIFEANNGAIGGIENHLLCLGLYEDALHELYRRQAEWNRQFACNCVELGVDMVHVSDDWGAQNGLMFSPRTWWDLIHPYHKTTADAVKATGAFLSLHSDGNVRAVTDGIIDLGYDVVHPWQESAGMCLTEYRRTYMDRFTVMGGLDVQTTIGFGRREQLEAEIRRVIGMFPDGGLLFCTTHFIQAHCSMDELTFAFDLIRDLVRGKR